MLTLQQIEAARACARVYYERAGIALTSTESATMEVSDLGLGNLESLGLELVVFVNTQRVCAKEIVLFPRQTCPEHLHPTINGVPGKEETFRVRWGTVYLYVGGEATAQPKGIAPAERAEHFKVWHEIVLQPGDQYTLTPDIWHWFQAGDEGAVVSEFSTRSTDEHDVFTDPGIVRITKVAGAA